MTEATTTSVYRITDLHESDRPRERLSALGPQALSNAELLAILLRVGVQGENAVQDASDYETIRTQLNHTASADWIRNHMDCDEWYRYHTVIEVTINFPAGIVRIV